MNPNSPPDEIHIHVYDAVNCFTPLSFPPAEEPQDEAGEDALGEVEGGTEVIAVALVLDGADFSEAARRKISLCARRTATSVKPGSVAHTSYLLDQLTSTEEGNGKVEREKILELPGLRTTEN